MGIMKARRKLIPKIDGDWKPLFIPERTGRYVNDHSVIQAADGSWHLFAITSLNDGIDPEFERYFVHGWGTGLDEGFTNEQKAIDHGTRAWAPGVIEHKGKYYMYYGPSPAKLAVSGDLHHWINHDIKLIGAPLESCHRDHMVMKLNDDTWLMYVVGLRNGTGCVSVFVSNDLISWRFVQYALITGSRAPLKPAWGAVESPYVVELEGYYYLFVTYTDCRKDNYHDTLVFRSPNPYNFGIFGGEGDEEETPVARLYGHASEIIRNPSDGAWYITTCGWRGMGVPHEGGVSIAKLIWEG